MCGLVWQAARQQAGHRMKAHLGIDLGRRRSAGEQLSISQCVRAVLGASALDTFPEFARVDSTMVVYGLMAHASEA